MDEANIKHLLHGLGINVQKVSYAGSKKRTRWLNVSCPFAPFTHAGGSDKNPSFGITIADDNRSYYKCLSCGSKGRLSALPSKLGGYRKLDYSKLRHWAELAELQATINTPIVDWEQSYDDHDIEQRKTQLSDELIQRYPSATGLPYLRERGIEWPLPLTLNLRYDDYQRRILFPCYDSNGFFRGFTGRSILSSKKLTKRNPKVRDYFGLNKRELFLDLPTKRGVGKTIIVEGLFDFAKLVQAGHLSTKCILGTALTPEKLDILIGTGNPVYFFMDNDLAGWTSLFGQFNEEGELNTKDAWAFQLYSEVPVWIVPYPTAFNNADPGSLSKKNINNAIKRAWLFTGRAPMDKLDNPNLLPQL